MLVFSYSCCPALWWFGTESKFHHHLLTVFDLTQPEKYTWTHCNTSCSPLCLKKKKKNQKFVVSFFQSLSKQSAHNQPNQDLARGGENTTAARTNRKKKKKSNFLRAALTWRVIKWCQSYYLGVRWSIDVLLWCRFLPIQILKRRMIGDVGQFCVWF